MPAEYVRFVRKEHEPIQPKGDSIILEDPQDPQGAPILVMRDTRGVITCRVTPTQIDFSQTPFIGMASQTTTIPDSTGTVELAQIESGRNERLKIWTNPDRKIQTHLVPRFVDLATKESPKLLTLTLGGQPKQVAGRSVQPLKGWVKVPIVDSLSIQFGQGPQSPFIQFGNPVTTETQTSRTISFCQGSLNGTRWPINERSPYSVGRGQGNAFVLNEDAGVSRFHGLFFITDTDVYVYDPGSTNGTIITTSRIPKWPVQPK